jgi:diguanylate cyclase (GGDEF)-like protein
VGRATDRLNERLLACLHLASWQDALDRLDLLANESGEPTGSALLKLLTNTVLGEDEARQLLVSAYRHRDLLQEKLGRKVDVRVSLFDLLVSVERRISNPKIIEMSVFDRIEHSAIYDHLTGVYNRSYFESRLSHEIRRARRYSQHLSLLILDLDDFKAINDTRGHPVGDAVLREVGKLVVDNIRDIDIASRYGGEEFAVILPETPRIGAFIVAERIRAQMQRNYRRKGNLDRALHATLSGGLACFPEDADGPEGLVARSDEALYRSKNSGKNQITIYYEEKRKDERVVIDERKMRATLRDASGSRGVRHLAVVKNISEGGLLVELTEPIPVGRELEVTFSLGLRDTYKLSSQVVRLCEFGVNGKRRKFEAGLRFQRRVKQLQPQLHRLARRHAAAG